MVQLNRIYTKTGDKGQTHLADSSRISKADLRVEAYGVVDEANAAIGVACLYVKPDIKRILMHIQNDLFDLGADLSTPADAPLRKKGEHLRVVDAQVLHLESLIDAYNEKLSPLSSFVLPGGSKASAYLHVARTSSRRAERLAVALAEKEDINWTLIRYLNRLSDLLFVLARAENNQGADDVLWVPGQNRETISANPLKEDKT